MSGIISQKKGWKKLSVPISGGLSGLKCTQSEVSSGFQSKFGLGTHNAGTVGCIQWRGSAWEKLIGRILES